MKTVECGVRKFTPSKIICMGQNYLEHAKEMGTLKLPDEPVLFFKPNSAIAFGSKSVFIPEILGLLHHEVELCFVIGKGGKNIAVDEAMSHIAGFAVGIDFTLREMQAAAKKVGGSWDLAKGFDNAAAFGKFIERAEVKDPGNLKIHLQVNDRTRQESNTREMIFSPPQILSFASFFMTIEEGDVFMCGTPAGVGEVKHRDVITAEIEALPELGLEVP